MGNIGQIFSVQRIELKDGRADGAVLVNVRNRSGMHFYVNMRRGMDIPFLDFFGENIGYISPAGVVTPQYFDDRDLGFLKSFTVGFLTTCGLKLAGAPCEYEGLEFGLHGNFSNTPADHFNYEIVENRWIPYAEIRGTVREAVIFGDKMKL